VSLSVYGPPKTPGAGHVATIYKRLTEDGKIRYTAYIRLKGHPRQSRTFDRKADAIRWAKQHETAVQTGRYLLSPEASKRTLADLIDRYTEHILPDLPASARDYARHLLLVERPARVLLSLRRLPPADRRLYGMNPALSWVTQHVVRTVGRKSP